MKNITSSIFCVTTILQVDSTGVRADFACFSTLVASQGCCNHWPGLLRASASIGHCGECWCRLQERVWEQLCMTCCLEAETLMFGIRVMVLIRLETRGIVNALLSDKQSIVCLHLQQLTRLPVPLICLAPNLPTRCFLVPETGSLYNTSLRINNVRLNYR